MDKAVKVDTVFALTEECSWLFPVSLVSETMARDEGGRSVSQGHSKLQ